MTHYSHNGSCPAPLPFRIRLSNGFTRTDPDTFTDDEIFDAGYTAVPDPPEYDAETQQLGWDGTEWTVSPLPQPVYTRISKYDLIMRLTDEEANMLLADLNETEGRPALLWNSIQYVDNTDPLYPMLRQIVVDRLGEERANEVLEPVE